MSAETDPPARGDGPDAALQRLLAELWRAIAVRRPDSPVVRPGTAERIWGLARSLQLPPRPPIDPALAAESHPLFAELSYHLTVAHAQRTRNTVSGPEFAELKWRIFGEI